MDRERETVRLRKAIERLHSPRLLMAVIVALAGFAGFLSSVALRHLGLQFLWLRYPIAVAAAYATFLLLLWCWLRLKAYDLREDFDVPGGGSDLHVPGGDPARDVFRPGGGLSGGGGASISFGEDPETAEAPLRSWHDSAAPESIEGSDAEDLAGIAAIAALAGAACVAVWLTVTAPTFLAELLLDTMLAAGLYRRVRGVEEGHWLRTAVRRTAWPFVCVVLGFALAGALMQTYAPNANSIGQVIRHFIESR